MRVVLEFQDEDSENSPLRKTSAQLSGRAARLSALPAARSCACSPYSAPAASRCSLPLCPARRCAPCAACTRSPHCPLLPPPSCPPRLVPARCWPPLPHFAPAASRCSLAVVPHAPPAPVPRTRRALYPPRLVPARCWSPLPHSVPRCIPLFARRYVPLAVVPHAPPAPALRTRRTPPPSFDCRHPRSTPLLHPPLCPPRFRRPPLP